MAGLGDSWARKGGVGRGMQCRGSRPTQSDSRPTRGRLASSKLGRCTPGIHGSTPAAGTEGT
eukprot:7075958-Prymnesium_polylepis.1